MSRKESEKLYDAITELPDALVEGAEEHKPRRRWRWSAAVAAVLVLAVAGGLLLRPGGSPLRTEAFAVALAEYPEMAPYPDESVYSDPVTGEFDIDGYMQAYDAWLESRRAQRNQAEGCADGLEGFFAQSIRAFLSGAGEENRVYSPLNVYMALAMLAELTDGESRAQILQVLGSGSIEDLRAQASALWNAHYRDDGLTTSILAASVWLNEEISFRQETLDTLARVYYASSFQGEMGSQELDQALQSWLDEQTGGLLSEQAGQITLNPDTVLALATTIYFQARWNDEFSERATQPGTFHAPGGDMECDFMHQSDTRTYYWGEQFSAVALGLTESGRMWLLLPDEGVEAEQLLADDQVMELLWNGRAWEDQKYLIVNLALPKFDVTSQLELTEGLQALGVTDVFDASVSDFSPMTGDVEGIYVSQAQHDTRVVIDEEGVTAAAYTVAANDAGAAPPDEEIDFVLDRPFLFAITSEEGLPLFVGVVNQPVE